MNQHQLRELIAAVKGGRVSRRTFVRQMVGLGHTVPLANQLLAAPVLSGTLLDVARSSYGAVHPEKGGVSTPEEVSKWWHQQRNSSAAHRIRENWLTAEDDKSRW